jgi:hypothetical protein
MFNDNTAEIIKCYVYRLIDPRDDSTFYVGKGSKNRVFHHLDRQITEGDMKYLQYEMIQEIRGAGYEPKVIIHRHGMDDDTAFAVEAALIDCYQNLKNCYLGVGSSDYGAMYLDDLVHIYELEEIEFCKDDKLMLIKIPKLKESEDVMARVQCAWRINIKRAERAQYVLAIKNGVILDVFIADKWVKGTMKNFPRLEKDYEDRWGFHGKKVLDKDILEKYIQKRLPSSTRKRGAANPIMYINI